MMMNVEWADLIIENSSFIKNNAPKYYNGGAIFISESNVNVSDSTFDSNTAYFSGGAVCFQSGKMTIDNSKFNNNSAGEMGGAIYECAGNIVVKNSLFDSNTAKESGGAISMSSEEYMVDACDFINCTADAGGAVYLGSKGTVKNTNFINNHANADGGVLYGEICEVNMDNCNFKNNIAGGFGAVIYAYSYNGERNDHDYYSENYHLTVTNSKFTKNIALNKTNILTVLENNQCKASNDIFIYGDDPQIYTENSTKIKFTTSKIKATLKAVKLSTEYNSGKKFKITLTDSEGTGLGYIDLAVKVYTGKKSTTYYLTTDYGGVAFDEASLLSPGVHKVVVSAISDEITASKKTSSIKISKASPVVKAPKVTNDYKKSKYFKVTVKSNKKPVKNIKLKVKVFNGKKYNIHTIKTNKKGIAKLNTKSLSKGTHKVIISSGNKNYKISAKSSIKIK